MKALFDKISEDCSRQITERYSTSFSMAVRMLAPSIRQDVHNIYGFVRLADEIVDTFHDYDKQRLMDDLQKDLDYALDNGISINPVLNAFQHTVHRYDIPRHLITSFMDSMRMDLEKKEYATIEDYKRYIYGSADVVGLMCLMIFVNGDEAEYERLKEPAMRLGSAFQKVNFLRDIKADLDGLERSYFPNVDMTALGQEEKQMIIAEIEDDFKAAYAGIVLLPENSRFGVYTAYRYYRKLLGKLKRTSHDRIMTERIRVGNHVKMSLLAKSYLRTHLNIL